MLSVSEHLFMLSEHFSLLSIQSSRGENLLTMKRFLENSSSDSDNEDEFEASRAKRVTQNTSSDDEEEEEKKHTQFKKVDVNLKNHVYEPVHFVRAHCKAGEMPEVNTQVKPLHSS